MDTMAAVGGLIQSNELMANYTQVGFSGCCLFNLSGLFSCVGLVRCQEQGG